MEYTLGAIKNPKDLRDIQLTQVQTPVDLPSKFITDISWIPVLSQLSNGSCVGHAHAVVHIYNEYKENNKIINLSPRYLYALSKKVDGIPDQQGTYPRITAKIESNKGCATQNTVPNESYLSHADYIDVVETDAITLDAKPYKIKGYAAVGNDIYSLKQAIVQNGLITITISVGNYNNPIKKGDIGLHRVVVYGFEGDRFLYRNSWGVEWGDQGNGYFDYTDQQISDALTFVDLPNELIIEAQKKYKYFSQAEVDKWKLKPELWKILDIMRGLSGLPFIITSGLRTPEQNIIVGGSSNSAHLRGLAADILCKNNVSRTKMIRGILNCGTDVFLEDARKHLHIDIDSSIHVLGQTVPSNDN